MTEKRWRRESPGSKRMLGFAKRIGPGIGGALSGACAVAYLLNADVNVLDPIQMVDALMLFGGIGGFVGADIAPPRRPVAPGDDLHKRADATELLSAAGTLIANLVAFIAAW